MPEVVQEKDDCERLNQRNEDLSLNDRCQEVGGPIPSRHTFRRGRGRSPQDASSLKVSDKPDSFSASYSHLSLTNRSQVGAGYPYRTI
jgi:hypothetical protein